MLPERVASQTDHPHRDRSRRQEPDRRGSHESVEHHEREQERADEGGPGREGQGQARLERQLPGTRDGEGQAEAGGREDREAQEESTQIDHAFTFGSPPP